MKAIELMQTGPVIPVIAIEHVESAVALARALVAGGVRVLEVTLRTPVALDAIRVISDEVDDAVVGVGTITRAQDFDDAVRAGAQFGVSPGLTPALVAAAKANAMPLLPGVMTPSDIIAARAAGFNELKLFPARQAGGVGMLKALAGPFPGVNFCPTGGINADNASEFLSLPNVVCVGGSWLTPTSAIANQDWAHITKLASHAKSLRTE